MAQNIYKMAINLQKGQRIEIGLQKVGVGLGWDPNEGTGYDFDLDASAFMLGENKKLQSAFIANAHSLKLPFSITAIEATKLDSCLN